jgi:dsDNA-binding SOS-regulon protein
MCRKQLKVAQLKEVLQQAGVAFKERDKKEELVAKILSNPKAASIANGNEQGPSAQAKASPAAAADDDLVCSSSL